MLRGLINRLEQQLWAHRAYKTVLRDWSGLPDLRACADSLSAMRASRAVAPIIMAFPAGKRILVLAPHPDDEIVGPGGTLIGALDSGSTVEVLYLTSGSKMHEEMRRREVEADAAAKACGYGTRFLRLTGLREGVSIEAANAVAKAICEFRPDILMVTFFADDHIEHQRASELLLQVYDGRQLDGSLETWAYQVYTVILANVIVDVTSVQERKAATIRLFESQMQKRDWAHFASGMTAYNSRFLPGPTARHAEMFHVAPLADYAELCRPYFHAH